MMLKNLVGIKSYHALKEAQTKAQYNACADARAKYAQFMKKQEEITCQSTK